MILATSSQPAVVPCASRQGIVPERFRENVSPVHPRRLYSYSISLTSCMQLDVTTRNPLISSTKFYHINFQFSHDLEEKLRIIRGLSGVYFYVRRIRGYLIGRGIDCNPAVVVGLDPGVIQESHLI